MRMNRKMASVMGATIAAAVFAVACSDSATTGPRSAFVPKSSFAVGDAATSTPVAGEVRVCKTSSSDTYGQFNVVNDGPSTEGTGNPTVIGGQPVTIQPNTCVVAVVDNGDASLQQGDWFHVTEVDRANVTESAPTCVGLEGPVNCASFFINNVHGVVVTFTNTLVPQTGNEGCTPGYWKQDQHLDSWVGTGFTPGQTLESVFDVPDSFGLDNVTLLNALSLKGGSTLAGAAETLLRAAVAAILNAASPDVDYAFTTAQIIAGVNAALASGDRNTILTAAAILDAANNGLGGCPLN